MDNEDKVNEIWISGTYTSVFFSRYEVEQFLDSVRNTDGSPPKNVNVFFVPRKLTTPKTKKEIKNATVEELKEWLGILSK